MTKAQWLIELEKKKAEQERIPEENRKLLAELEKNKVNPLIVCLPGSNKAFLYLK